ERAVNGERRTNHPGASVSGRPAMDLWLPTQMEAESKWGPPSRAVSRQGAGKRSASNLSRKKMRYVILRDDDTNALTPVECLERLYRPFLERGLPVNLSVIPEVRTTVTLSDGRPEGFLMGRLSEANATRPIAENPNMVRY